MSNKIVSDELWDEYILLKIKAQTWIKGVIK